MIDDIKAIIAVFNTAAETSGAMAELHRFRTETEKYFNGSIVWHYVLGRAQLPESKSVKIHCYPWTKKSWASRIYFDTFIARRIIHLIKADYIISLQNNTISCKQKSQLLFVQLCFPFVSYKFPINQVRLWLHQNIIGLVTLRSIRKATIVVVQNEWMKEACARKAKIDKNKIRVLKQSFVPPSVFDSFKPTSGSFKSFFFPATNMPYKNHSLLLKAAAIVKQEGNTDFHLVLTLYGNDNDRTLHLRNMAEFTGVTVHFVGSLSREDVFKKYSESVLVFPSLIETVGLPLVEAKATGCVIFAYDAEYSRDVLKGYSDAYFFTDEMSLSALLRDCIAGKIVYHGGFDTYNHVGESWAEILEYYLSSGKEFK